MSAGRRAIRPSRTLVRSLEVDVPDDIGGHQVIRRRILTADDLAPLRDAAPMMARAAGFSEDRARQFALVVDEMAANTIVHANDTGDVTLMRDEFHTVYARITDRGPGFRADATIRE